VRYARVLWRDWRLRAARGNAARRESGAEQSQYARAEPRDPDALIFQAVQMGMDADGKGKGASPDYVSLRWMTHLPKTRTSRLPC